MNSGIYTITHLKTKKVYVGSSANITKRWRCHKLDLKLNRHHCSHLQRAYNKYGTEAFEFNIVQIVEPDRKLLLEAEQKWMDRSPKLYNTCKVAGSPLGTKQTKAHRQAISKALKGKPKSAEHVEANRLAQLAVPRNEENIQRWAKNRLGSQQTAEHVAKRAESQKATKALRTAEQNQETRILRCRARGWIVSIEGVEYLSYADAEQRLGICKRKLMKQYPKST